MPSYLDRYGEGHDERARRIKRAAAAILIVVVIAGGLYLRLVNNRQKSQVKQFVALLQKRDYTGAYRMWGCTEAKPCPAYDFNKFLEDWGPKSKYAQIASFDITKSKACGSGVIVTVDFSENREERFWVEDRDLTLGYSPWQVCPSR